MNALVDELAKAFDECLDSVLSDPQQQQQQKQQKEEGNEGLDTQIKTLKTTFLEIENYLKEVRLNALADRPLAVKEANKLLQRDIDIKTNMTSKYVAKLDEWDSKIPNLIENSKKALALRTDGTDFQGNPKPIVSTPLQEEQITVEPRIEQVQNHTNEDDDDDDDDVEFEEV